LLKVGSIGEVIQIVMVLACVVAWAMAGFPHFVEVAWVFVGLACAGIGIIWNKK
jgi:hypothetical protein